MRMAGMEPAWPSLRSIGALGELQTAGNLCIALWGSSPVRDGMSAQGLRYGPISANAQAMSAPNPIATVPGVSPGAAIRLPDGIDRARPCRL